MCFSAATIERWYYKSRQNDDPVRVLERRVRKDCGKVSLAPALTRHLSGQYRDHPHWSYQLHYDNLAAAVKADPSLGPLRSYCTVRRYMQRTAWSAGRGGCPAVVPAKSAQSSVANSSPDPQLRSRVRRFPLAPRFPPRLAQGAHLPRAVACPLALGILDDHSRLCCHLQWYLSETAEDLVHGLLAEYSATGLPPAYLPKNPPSHPGETP